MQKKLTIWAINRAYECFMSIPRLHVGLSLVAISDRPRFAFAAPASGLLAARFTHGV
jgi:hypothetical protein